MTYAEKLKDPRWQKKRLIIFKRDKFKCVYCKDSNTSLHVHHEKYKKDPWDSLNEDLKTVCEHCHQLIHFIPSEWNINNFIIIQKVVRIIDLGDFPVDLFYRLYTNESVVFVLRENGGFKTDGNFYGFKVFGTINKTIKKIISKNG